MSLGENMADHNRRFQVEVESAEEWEAKWDEFVPLAREYGWPEDYLQGYLQSHRVSFQERIESLDSSSLELPV